MNKNGKTFALAMAVLWGIVFGSTMHNWLLGACVGLCMGLVFGLFGPGKDGRKEGETAEENPEEAPPPPAEGEQPATAERAKEFIAFCGLDCEACEARAATVNDDDELRRKVAADWSKLNGVEITPEMINCVGCRIDGVKTPFCESLCPIRRCALGRGVETCGDCADMDGCEKLGMITGSNADALKNLKG